MRCLHPYAPQPVPQPYGPQFKEFKSGKEPVKIGVRLDDDNAKCPEGDYDEYSVGGAGSYKPCLMLNAQEGECLANTTSTTTDGYLRVDCSDPRSEVKILKVVGGTASESAWDSTDADTVVVYSQPAETLCVTTETGHI